MREREAQLPVYEKGNLHHQRAITDATINTSTFLSLSLCLPPRDYTAGYELYETLVALGSK